MGVDSDGASEAGEADPLSDDGYDSDELRPVPVAEGETAGADGDSESNSDSEEEQETAASVARKAAYFADPTTLPSASSLPSEELPTSFQALSLSRPILKGLASLGFVAPTPIQARTIPVALLGKDVVGGAVTGSGKTAAFLVPTIERLLYRDKRGAGGKGGNGIGEVRVVVLCPTRELAIQCHEVGLRLAAFTDVRFALTVGGLSLKAQEAELRLRPDVVIATPGRLVDHLRNTPGFSLDMLDILVIDEADRMLEDGFAAELNEIVSACPRGRQTMLFSATMTDSVDSLIRLSLTRPVRLFVSPKRSTADGLTQEFVRIRREMERPAVLVGLCKRTFAKRCIVFFRSKALAHQMRVVFGLMGLKAEEIHGNLSQEQRLNALHLFRTGEVDYLLATDLASRGIDIKGIETVINYDMPMQIEQYLHRVGRTARAGREGR